MENSNEIIEEVIVEKSEETENSVELDQVEEESPSRKKSRKKKEFTEPEVLVDIEKVNDVEDDPNYECPLKEYDIVKLKTTAVMYYNGKRIPPNVKNSKLYVKKTSLKTVKGVIPVSTNKYGSICGFVRVSDVYKV